MRGSPNVAALLRNEKLPCSSDVLESFWMPKSSPTIQGNFLHFFLLGFFFRLFGCIYSPLFVWLVNDVCYLLEQNVF